MELKQYKRNKNKELKYIRIANTIVDQIKRSNPEIGYRLPSIYQQSKDFKVSRETIFKTYRHLRKKKIIKVVQGKGHYFVSSGIHFQAKVLCLFNELDDMNISIFNSIVQSLKQKFKIDIREYGSGLKVLSKQLSDNMHAYDFLVVIPGFTGKDPIEKTPGFRELLTTTNKINAQKLFVVGGHLPGINGDVVTIFQDFENDIREIFDRRIKGWRQKYDKLIILNPWRNKISLQTELVKAMVQYCNEGNVKYEFQEKLADKVEAKKLFFVLEDDDLVRLIKQVKRNNMTIGQDVGIVSCNCNDHPMKKLMGISTLGPDHEAMAEMITGMIRNNQKERGKEELHFYDWGSA